MKRFTTSSHHDPTITQRVRNALIEGGNYELAMEQIVDGMRDVEQMTRGGLANVEKRILMLEEAERERLTKTTVIELIRAKANADVSGWAKWGIRAALAGLGSALLLGLGEVLKLAWRGLHA